MLIQHWNQCGITKEPFYQLDCCNQLLDVNWNWLKESLPFMYSLTRSAGEKFYSNVSNIDLAKVSFHIVASISLVAHWTNNEATSLWKTKKLLFDTRTKYFVFHCQLQWIDCRRFWSLRYTQRGACLQLQPQAVYNYDKKTKVCDEILT